MDGVLDPTQEFHPLEIPGQEAALSPVRYAGRVGGVGGCVRAVGVAGVDVRQGGMSEAKEGEE